MQGQPWLLYGIYLFCLGTVMYVVGILMVFPRYIPGTVRSTYTCCRMAGLV